MKSKDEIPADVQSLYVERDEACVLDVEGAADAVQLRAKLDEFRTNNTARARSVFRLVSGAPQALEADGQTVRVGRDGVTPLTMTEWLETQVSEAPHLFESNAGGGAAGNGSGGVGQGSGKNPFRRETWNVTEQMRLAKADPQLAARLRQG